MPSSEREMIRSIVTIFGAAFAFLLVWAGTTFALSGLVSPALVAGSMLGLAVLLLGGVLVRRLWRRRVEGLRRLNIDRRDDPQGSPLHLPGVAAAPPRDLP